MNWSRPHDALGAVLNLILAQAHPVEDGFCWEIESDSILAAFLEEGDEWQCIYIDDIASIFLRNTAQNATLISKYAEVSQ